MDFNEEYDQNLLINRPKSFLNFSEVDNEFLTANNFAVLNLDNEEVADPDNIFNFNSDPCDQLENEVPKTQDSPKEIINRPKAAKRKRNKQKSHVLKSFCCDLCDNEFPNLRQLKVHKSLNHILTKFYKCQECFKDFNFEKNFMLHLATHTAAPAKCPECGKIFQRISSFIGHIETHMDDDNFKCKNCDLEFEFEEYYDRHMQKVHKEAKVLPADLIRKRNRNTSSNKNSGKYLCKICGKSFPKLSLLVRHELGHTKTKPFECLECSQRFSQKSSLQRHYLVHEGIKPFNCPECNLRFSQRTNLITHMKRVHPAKEDLGNKFQCNNCPCAFNKLNSLNRHITLMHSKVAKDADKNLSINELLEQIKWLQDDPSEQRLGDNSAIQEPIHNTLQTTTQHYHTGCSFSPSKMEGVSSSSTVFPGNLHEDTQYRNLVDHFYPDKEHTNRLVREVHVGGVKRLECLHCHKNFQRPFDIVRHMRVHTKERPFACEICGRKFSLKSTLKIHMKVHKKGRSAVTKPYECHVCKKHFHSAKKLELHAELHSSYKSQQCLNYSGVPTSMPTLDKCVDIQECTIQNQIVENHPPIPRQNEEPPKDSINIEGTCYMALSGDNRLGLKTFKCLTCQRQFTSESSLQNHKKLHLAHKAKEQMLLVHSDQKCIIEYFACPHCQKTFERKDSEYHQHVSSHMENTDSGTPPELSQNIEQNLSVQNLVHDPLPCNYVLLLDDPTSSNIDLEDLNLVPHQPDDLLFVDFSKIPGNEISEEADNFLDMISQPESQRNDLVTPSEFINIRDLSSTKNHLSQNIVVVSHEKDTESCDNPHHPPLAGTSTQLQEFLFQDVREKIIETAEEKQKGSKNKPPHVCHVCKRIFKKPIDLRRHIRTHTKEKPFQCDVCSKAFSLKCILDDHKLIHQKDRPAFDCQVCGKKYASKNVLNIHLRLHTGEKPYKCEICQKNFRTSGHRIVHMRIHSKEKMEAAKKKKR